jgi:hypothetical protein
LKEITRDVGPEEGLPGLNNHPTQER